MGRPTIAATTALDVESSTLFRSLLPGLLVAECYAIFMAYMRGKKERKRLNFDPKTAKDLPPALATLAAGEFSGILGGSGMSTALATSLASVIPASLGTHMVPIYAVLAAPAICFLPQDAFYFGITSVIAGVMGQFGVNPDQAAVASMVGQSFRLISPVIPALYMLCERTEINFVDFQKEYTKYAWPILFIYLAVHTITGVMPF